MKKKLFFLFILFIFSWEYAESQLNFWEKTNGPNGLRTYFSSVSNNSEILSVTEKGIYLSEDKGITWVNYSSPSIKKGFVDQYLIYCYSEYYHTKDVIRFFKGVDHFNILKIVDDTVYTFITDLCLIKNDHLLVSLYGKGIYRSTDQGLSWVNVQPLDSDERINSFFCEGNGNIFAAGNNLYHSSNDGLTWNKIYSFDYKVNKIVKHESNYFILKEGQLYHSNDGQNWILIRDGWIDHVEISINGILYISSNNRILYSTNNGITWNKVNFDFWNAEEIYHLVVDKDENLYVSTDWGLFISCGALTEWQNIGFPISVNAITSNVEGLLFAGTEQYGVYVSDDEGMNWIPTSLKYFNAKSLAVNSVGEVFAAVENYYVCKTINNGFSWMELEPFNMNIIYVDKDDNVITAGLKSMLYYYDGNSQWKLWNEGIRQGTEIISIYQHPITEEYFIGTTNGLYKASSLKSVWNYIEYFEWDMVNTITSNPSGDLFVGTDDGIYKSSDGGATWIGPLLPQKVILSLVINNEGHIYASTYSEGVYRSLNGGVNWVPLSYTPEEKSIPILKLTKNGYILAGIEMNGVYRSKSKVTSTTENNLVSNYLLYQNYPNPFNSSTTIKYELPNESFVTLKVYNLLGQEVATLVNENKKVGKYEIVFDGSNLPSGVYYYRIMANSYVATKKLLLLR